MISEKCVAKQQSANSIAASIYVDDLNAEHLGLPINRQNNQFCLWLSSVNFRRCFFFSISLALLRFCRIAENFHYLLVVKIQRQVSVKTNTESGGLVVTSRTLIREVPGSIPGASFLGGGHAVVLHYQANAGVDPI